MDKLVKFCLDKELQVWMKQYKAPAGERAFAKDIPNRWYDHQMANKLAKVIQIRRKYRGSSSVYYRRPTAYCHKQWADRFALYER
jgi:hypothetical protein